MKALAIGVVLFLVVIAAEAVRVHGRPRLQLRQKSMHRSHNSPALTGYTATRSSKFDFCNMCIQFTEEGLDALLQIILNTGVVGTCGALCTALENKTHSEPIGVACNILCDVVGIKEFISIIDKADLDPIYFCELTKSCKVFDNGDAEITSLTVTPAKGHKGETFAINMDYTSKNGTGTGMRLVEIMTIDGLPISNAQVVEPQQPGEYRITWNLSTKNGGCDPSQGPCEQWLPGDYGVKTFVCNGECGSKHPHSKIYDSAVGNFTIVEQ